MSRDGAEPHRPGSPVAFAVADTPEAAAEVWPQLEGLYLRISDRGPFAVADFRAPHRPGSLPWCAALTLIPDPAMHWLGDFERYVAWAWLTRPK